MLHSLDEECLIYQDELLLHLPVHIRSVRVCSIGKVIVLPFHVDY